MSIVSTCLLGFVLALFSVVNGLSKEFREQDPVKYWGLATPAIILGFVIIALGIFQIVSSIKNKVRSDELTTRAVYKSGFFSFLFVFFGFVVLFIVIFIISLTTSKTLAEIIDPIIILFITTILLFSTVLFFIVMTLIIQKKGYVSNDQ